MSKLDIRRELELLRTITTVDGEKFPVTIQLPANQVDAILALFTREVNGLLEHRLTIPNKTTWEYQFIPVKAIESLLEKFKEEV